jgi:hypothetical protein
MQRPISVTVFGIFNFVFAALVVIGLAASFAVLGLPADSNNPIIRFIHESPRYAIWLKICIALGGLSCAFLLVSGFGLLSMKPWARALSIAYATYAIAFCLGGMLINLIFMVQPMLGQAPQQRAFETVAAIGGPISGTIGGFFWIIYPLVLLAFMLRPKMVTVFRPPASLETQPQPS